MTPETIRETTRLWQAEPDKAKGKPVVKAHSDGAVPDLLNIPVTISVQTPDPDEHVQRLYQVWQERCPIHLVLTKAQQVSTALEIRHA